MRKAIIQGEFPPGEKVTIKHLAELYGVSAMPVREALNRLQSERFVHFERRSIIINQLSPKELLEIFEVRKSLEKTAMERSFLNLKKQDLLELEKIVKEMDKNLHLPYEWNQLNKQFHLKIYSYSNAKFLLELLDLTWGRLEPYMHIYSSSTKHPSFSQEDHYKFIEYIKNKDKEKLIRLTVDHIQETCASVLAEIDK